MRIRNVASRIEGFREPGHGRTSIKWKHTFYNIADQIVITIAQTVNHSLHEAWLMNIARFDGCFELIKAALASFLQLSDEIVLHEEGTFYIAQNVL